MCVSIPYRSPRRYVARIVPEARLTECITNLKDCVKWMLRRFCEGENSSIPPANVLYYRDGVSDGEFAALLLEEYTAIKTARPPLTNPKMSPPSTTASSLQNEG
jgi:hypothetical protein